MGKKIAIAAVAVTAAVVGAVVWAWISIPDWEGDF